MAAGIERIQEMFTKAQNIIENGKTIRSEVESGIQDVQTVYDTAMATAQNIDQGIDTFKATCENPDAAKLVEMFEKAKEIKGNVSDIRTQINDIYTKGKDIIDKLEEMYDDGTDIIKELQNWRQIKKEIEKQLDDTKLKILTALKSCQNLAKSIPDSEDWKEMASAISTVKGIDMMSSAGYAKIKEAITNAVKPDTLPNWFSSSEHANVDAFKEDFHNEIEKRLEKLLEGAQEYVLQSEAWKKIEQIQTTINTVMETLADLKLTGSRSKSKGLDLETYVTKWMSIIDDFAKEKLGEIFESADQLISAMGPGVKIAETLFKSFRIAKEFEKALQDVPDSLDPFIAKHGGGTHVFYDNKRVNLFKFEVKVPIASIGWISATFSAGIESHLIVNLSVTGQLYNFMKDSETKIADGSVNGGITLHLSGHIGLGVDLLGIVQGDIIARLRSTLGIEQAKGTFSLTKTTSDPLKGGLAVGGNATAKFQLNGELVLKIQVSTFVGLIIKAVASLAGRPAPKLNAETIIGSMVIYEASKNLEFNTTLHYDNSILPDFNEINQKIREIGNISEIARTKILEKIEGIFGTKNQLKESAQGAPITDEEMADLKASLQFSQEAATN